MSLDTDLPETYILFKLLIASIAAWIAATFFSACGFSSPGGYVIGTTSYLAEYNEGFTNEHTEREKRQLARIIER